VGASAPTFNNEQEAASAAEESFSYRNWRTKGFLLILCQQNLERNKWQ